MTETCAAADMSASALQEATRENNAESVNIEEMEVEGVNEAEGKGEGNAKVSGEVMRLLEQQEQRSLRLRRP